MISDENLALLDSALSHIKACSKETPFRAGAYSPVYRKGDIVQCEFIGVGNELNLRHFAIVWCSKPDNPNINVIPLTSKLKDESEGQFRIGIVPGFYTKTPSGNLEAKESFVYLDKLMEVSRKRVDPKYEQDASGNFIKTTKGHLKQLSISSSTIERIDDSMRLFYLNEGYSLYSLIKDKIDIHYQLNPNSLTTDLLDVGFRRVESYAIYHINNDICLICIINKKRYSLKFSYIDTLQQTNHTSRKYKSLYHSIKWNDNIYNVRKILIKALFSRTSSKVTEAKNILTNFWI